MKLVILLFLLFGYINGQTVDCSVDGGCPDGVCTPNDCPTGCVPSDDTDPPSSCIAEAGVDTTDAPSETVATVNCEDDLDENNWTFEYIGKSTQFRLIDPCNDKHITFKMEDLTEYDADGKKTRNKETAFASIKDWEADYSQSDTKIVNTFEADQLTKVDAKFKLVTEFFRDTVDIPDPDDSSQNITLDKNNFKFSVEIFNWVMEADDNYLELCVTIKTNSPGTFDRSGNDVSNGQYEINNPATGTCNGTSIESIDVKMTEGGNGNNQLSLCYKFDSCNGDIYYDPILKMNMGSAHSISVFVGCVVAIMSLFFA